MIWNFLWTFLLSFAGTIAALFLLLGFSRQIIQSLIARFTELIMSEPYHENIMEILTATTRMTPIIATENNLRAETGSVIKRPFGSPRKFLGFDGLIFSPAQLAVFPETDILAVDTRITIGPQAAKPLILDIPLLMGAVGFGVAVSSKAKIAIAKGTAAAGTASNSGEGGFLPEERAYAKYLIVQYSKAKWSQSLEVMRQADAVEIHFGQGATAASPITVKAQDVEGRARELLGLAPGEDGFIPSRYEEIKKPEDLRMLVDSLRQITGGVPIGVKLSPGNRLEEDLEFVLHAGVDFISLDGSRAGTKGGPPILEDDFGLPIVYALSRAVHFLQSKGVKDRISLLVGGGFFVPGDCLKAMALGADAVYMVTAPLWAMTHTQIAKVLPFEPPTNLILYTGPQADEFDEEEASYYLKNFFQSCTEEIKTAVVSLGKTAVRDVNADDLAALDEWTSQVTGIPLAYRPSSSGSREVTDQ